MSQAYKNNCSGSPTEGVADAELHRYHPYFTTNGLFRYASHGEDFKNLKYQCLLCLPKHRVIKASRISSSNLRTHLFRVHNFDLKALEQGAKIFKRQTPKKPRVPEEKLVVQFVRSLSETAEGQLSPGHPSPGAQQGSTTAPCGQLPPGATECSPTHSTFENLVTTMIADNVLPFAFVENESFKRLIQHLQPTAQIPPKLVILQNIEESFESMKVAILEALSPLEHVCVTADLWRSNQNNFLGVTAHWLNSETLARHCAAVACRKVVVKPSHDVIARQLNDVFQEFDLEGKVTKIQTDNWGDVVCTTETESRSLSTVGENGEAHTGLDVIPIDIGEILDAGTDKTKLPTHHRCVSHTLNLIASKDAGTALDDDDYRKMHCSVFDKTRTLWDQEKQHRVANPGIKEEAISKLVTPKRGSWTSTYHAMKCLARMAKEDDGALHVACLKAQIRRFTDAEMTFIVEYCKALQPVVMALGLLQSGDGCCVGYVIPTVRQLLETFEKYMRGDETVKPLETCRPLASALWNGTNERFKNLLSNQEYLIAAILVPRFKLLWANAEESRRLKQTMKQILREQVVNTSGASDIELSLNDSSDCGDEDQAETSFFSFEAKRRKLSNPDPIDSCVDNYLASGCSSLAIYQSSNLLKPFYRRYDTALCSSPHLGQLFSASKSKSISDEHFEMQLMLRYNNKFSNF